MLKNAILITICWISVLTTWAQPEHTIVVKKEVDTLAEKYFKPGTVYSGKITLDNPNLKTKGAGDKKYIYAHLIILDDTACAVFETVKKIESIQKQLIKPDKLREIAGSIFSYVATTNRIEIGGYCSRLGWEQIYLGKVEKEGELIFGNVYSSVASGTGFKCRTSNLVLNFPYALFKED